ncbi:MAG: hypothetical protein UT32_C0002G0053 [Parcubacteria group bacterium GW2011_GWC2_39_14]|nr:MAG: hypothetical protein UT32_C0002G0053 [Parcubacteria group bacterium GW2011_GWC2_39_14]KKR55278.1 MAG: hypothetical protein UT91_C0003G0053 [Parcubacteria group bacterium GW2011_GWA2_40_23]
MLQNISGGVRTSYGVKREGKTEFVIVAPHAGGDDRCTGKIARLIGKQLEAGIVINKFFFKKTNSRAEKLPDRAIDFNRLYWSSRQGKYIWKKQFPAMKEFYTDIGKFCDRVAERSHKKAVAVYIHGMNIPRLGIDIGVGMKAKGKGFRFEGSLKSPYYCSGVATLQLSQVKKIKKLLETGIMNKYGLMVGVGKHYPAWSKRIAVQFHKTAGRDDYALQLEIDKELRNSPEDLVYISNLISESLKNTFC